MIGKNGMPNVRLVVCANALRAIFNECDRYDRDETGGRIIGTYSRDGAGNLAIRVAGVIEPGPNAKRSPSSFFQDGDYQAQVFRQIEAAHPSIEHLGNWHTHHVNGYPTLSAGDIGTYRRIVNHDQHNTDFFYALLVIARNPVSSGLQRYRVRHYVLFRNDEHVYELGAEQIRVSDEATIWPISESRREAAGPSDVAVRSTDKVVIEQLYPGVRPYRSKRAEMVYWKGQMQLVDESVVQVTIPELIDEDFGDAPYYQVILKDAPQSCAEVVEDLRKQQFPSAAVALRGLEQSMNRALYRRHICPEN